MAEIDGGLMQRQFAGGSPKLERVAVTVTAMAIVTTGGQVRRETATTQRRGLVQGADSVPLRAGPGRGFPPEKGQDLLYRDFGAQHVEVDAGHS